MPVSPIAGEFWFLTGSQGMYGEETLAQVATQSQEVCAQLAGGLGDDRAGGVEAGAHRRRRHPHDDARGQLRPLVPGRDHVDAHVLAGQDVDRWPRRPGQAAAAPAHPGQRVPAVEHDRHGLHEPEPGRARRPRVRLHPDPPGPEPARRRGPRQLPGHGGRRLVVGAGRDRAGPPAVAAVGAVRRQHAQRRRHRGRQGRGRAALRRLGEHLRGQRPGDRRRRGRGHRRSTPWSRSTATATTSHRNCA